MNVICEYRDPAGILEKYLAMRIETELLVVEAGIPCYLLIIKISIQTLQYFAHNNSLLLYFIVPSYQQIILNF